MSDDLRILISASLQKGESIKNINEVIKEIQKKITSLNIKIDIDGKILETLSKFSESFGSISKTTSSANNSLSKTTDEIKEQTNAINKATEAERKWRLEQQRTSQNTGKQTSTYGNNFDNSKQIVYGNTDGTVRDIVNVTNALKDLKEEEDLINKMYEGRMKSEERVRDFERQWNENQEKWIQKNAELDRTELEKTEKLKEKAYIENKKREEDFYRLKARLAANIADIDRRFGADDSVKRQLSALNDELRNTTSVGNYKDALSKLDIQLKNIVASSKTATSHAITLGEQLKIALERFPIWMVATTAFFAPLRALQDGIQQIYDLDKAMVDLQKVTEATSHEYEQFIINAREVGDSIGNTTLNVIKSATEWARLGYNIQQAQELASQTLVYQNVGDISSAEDASTDLIAAIKGFNIEIDQQGANLEHLIDVYNEVGNRYSISSAGIGAAAKRGASAMHEAGNTLEQSVALITAANSAVQDPAKVGNAMKTISLRLRGVNEEGEAISGLLPTLEKKFNSIGLTLKKDETTFLSTYEIFKSLSGVWNTLNGLQKSDFLESIAGKEQANVAASLITNWKDAEGALEAGLNSFGSAAKENEKYLDSMAGRIAVFQNQVTSFWNSSTNTETFKQLIDLGTLLVKTVESVSNTFGGLGSAIGVATLATLTFNSALRTKALTAFGIDLKAAALATKIFTGSTIAARVAVTALQASMTLGLSLAITGIVAGFTTLYSKYQEQKEIQKELQQQNELIANSWINQKEHIAELLTEYQKLSDLTQNGSIFSNVEQEQKYRDVVEELSSLMPNLVSEIDSKGQKHLKNAAAIQEELKYAEQLANLERQQNVLDAESNFDDQVKSLDKLQDKITDIQAKIQMGGKYISNGYTATFLPYSESDLNKFEIELLNLQNQVATSSNVIRDNVKSLVTDILSINKVELNDNVTKELENIIGSLNVDGLSKKELADKSNSIASLITKINTLSTTTDDKSTQRAMDAINDYGDAIGLTEEQVNSLINTIQGLSTEQDSNTKSAVEFASQMDNLSKSVENTVSSLTTLSSAYQTLNQGEQLSADAILQLIDQYPELASYLAQTNDLTFNKGELLKQVAETQRQARLEEVQSALDSVEVTRNELQQKQDLYKQYFENLLSSGGAIDAWMFNSPLTKEEQTQLELLNTEADKLKAKIAALSQPLNFYSGGVSKSSKSKSATQAAKDEAKLQDITEARINSINALASAQSKLNETLSQSIDSDSSNYAAQIKKTNELLDSQVKEINLLQSANLKLRSERDKLQASNSKYDMSTWIDANGEATESFIKLYNSMGSGSAQESLQSLYDQYSQYTLAIRENRSSVADIVSENKSLKDSLDELKLSYTQAYLDKRNSIVDSYDTQIKKSQQVQSLLSDESQAYIDEINNQVSAYESQMDALEDYNDWIRNRLASNENAKEADKLTSEQVRILTEQLESNSDAWYKAAKSAKDSAEQIIQIKEDLNTKALDYASQILETQKKVDQYELDQEEKRLNVYKERQQAQIESIQAEIDALQEKWKLEEQIAQEKEYQQEIARLTQIAAILQNGTLADLSDEMAEQLGLAEEKAKQIEYQNRLLEAQKKLENVQNEKNTRLFMNGSFQWVADPQAVRDAQEDLDDIKKDYEDFKSDELTNVLDELKNQQEAYDEWLKEREKEATIAALESQIKAIQDKIALREEEFNQEQEAFNSHYENMEILAAEFLDSLKETYGNKWDEILGVLQEKLSSAESMYNQLLGYSGSSLGGSSTNESKSSSSNKSVIDQMKQNSETWKSADSTTKKQLNEQNQRLAASIGATYNPATGKYKDKNGIPLYHDGPDAGIVGSDETLDAWIAKHEGRNEQLSKLLKGELVLDKPENVLKSLAAGYSATETLNRLSKITSNNNSNTTYDESVTVGTMNIQSQSDNIKNIIKTARQMVKRSN